MKTQDIEYLNSKLLKKGRPFPLLGLVELTYRCNLDCIHCYCKGSEDKNRELDCGQWKNILDTIYQEGCLWLTFSGGDPLVRDDFLDIYAYARKKGFIISLFTNGQAFTAEIIDYLVQFPPYVIEITLNGITANTYEAVTGVAGSYLKAMDTIELLAAKKLPLILKANCLRQNRHELVKIKEWTEQLLGKPQGQKHFFKYDPMIYPRFNGEKTPCGYRLSAAQMEDLVKEDADIWQEYKNGLHHSSRELERDREWLYRCDAWKRQFFINPYGRLKFCQFTEKFSINLQTTSFAEGFYRVFPRLLDEKFKTDSKCKTCSARASCYFCPPRAYLETKNEEAPVSYYCELAQAAQEQRQRVLQDK